MKNNFRIITSCFMIAALLLCMPLGGCRARKDTGLTVSGKAIMHEEEFGGVYIDLTIDDFNALGFAYGDSVDVTFSNGYRLEGIPYYRFFFSFLFFSPLFFVLFFISFVI